MRSLWPDYEDTSRVRKKSYFFQSYFLENSENFLNLNLFSKKIRCIFRDFRDFCKIFGEFPQILECSRKLT